MVSFTDALTLGGGLLGAGASLLAGRQQSRAAGQAVGEQRRQFDITRADLAPFREQGVNALNQFAASVLGPLEATPAFQFRLNEGLRALDQIAAARGKALSGQQVRGALTFADALAADEANTQLNRLASLAGVGQTAVNTGGALGANAATNIGQFLTDQGAARASGFVGGANAITDSINNLLLLNALR